MTSNSIWVLGDKELTLDRPRIMAIVNADPESFHPGSRISGEAALIRERLALLAADGADILDIGGQSTRPGSVSVGPAEELRRVIPVLEGALELSHLRERDGGPMLTVSVDTFHAEVAREALALGVHCVNDISAGSLDPQLWETVAGSDCGYVLMHMQGTPADMQQAPHYDDCVAEVGAFLSQKLAQLEALGVAEQRVALDPGIGFGKRLQDNLALISGAGRLRSLAGAGYSFVGAHGCAPNSNEARTGAHPCAPTHGGPSLLYGLSRKSFIKSLMNEAGRPEAAAAPEQRLPASLGAAWHLLDQGVMLHRVHDVAETRQLMSLWEALNSGGTGL
ncbi:dihydropteroate synthase [bacterium]|nr:dihydropteroate synthase [bacterium]